MGVFTRAGTHHDRRVQAVRADAKTTTTTAVTFEEVYRAHVAFVWRSLRRLGIREEDAADAAQEVFIVVHRKLPEFAGRSKLTT